MGALRAAIFCYISVLLMANVRCDAPPSMQDAIASPTRVREGEDAMLTCVIGGGNGVATPSSRTVLWMKRHQAINRVLTAGDARTTSDARISVLHDSAQRRNKNRESEYDVWVLAIKSASLSDSGVYICELNTDPVVRSFHKLEVVPSSGVTSLPSDDNAKNGKPYWDPSLSLATAHNYTGCCESANVSDSCYGFCNVQAILDGTAGQDPENCEQDFPAIRRCMTDGRNHMPCCIQEKIPDICLDVCRGEYTPVTDSLKSHVSCSAFMDQIVACIVGGIELLPGPPRELDVEPLTEKSLRVSWSVPRANGASVTEYVVNVTYLTSFDGSQASSGGESYVISPIPELRSWQVRVPANGRSTVLNNLAAFTMYEITATAVNVHGASAPSDAVRSLTLSPGILKPLKVAEPPRLPDTRQCCIERGITNTTCMDMFCDASNANRAKENDLLHCASRASDAFACLANGHDHTPCCKSRGLPDSCQELCRGNVTAVHYTHLKCLEYMTDYVNCLLQGYGVLPGPPAKVHVTNVAPYFAIVHWSAPPTLGDTVQYYNLHYRRAGTEDGRYAIIKRVHPPYILENLESNLEYEVYVDPVNAHGIGEPSARLIFRTQSKLFQEQVKKAQAYNVTSCCSAVALSDVCMPLCTYDAKMSDLRSLANVCAPEFHKVVRCGVGGRNHGDCCERRGVPETCLPLCNGFVHDTPVNITKNCISHIGNVVQCFEEGTNTLPAPVEELYAVCLNNTALRLKWNAPRSGPLATHYVVHYKRIRNESAYEIALQLENQINTTSTAVLLNGVQERALYNVLVTAHNGYGSSLPSSILLVNCSKQNKSEDVFGVTSAPHSLAVAGHSATWITISWQPPVFSHPGEIISYRFYYRPADSEEFKSIPTSVTSHTLDKLSPNKQYVVYVTAHIPQGGSLPSETLVAWTDPAYPAFVEPPTIHPVNLITEGSTMTVLCIAMGTPMPTISLYISGRLVRQEITRHMVTKIHNVTRDMDQISCYADNGYGTPMQASKKITISHAPIVQASGMTMAVLGGSAVFDCNVTAVPQPQMAFWRDPLGRVPVIQGPKYDISIAPDNEEKSRHVMRLIIQEITELDEGDYFCHAENAFGSIVRPVAVRIHNTASSHNVTQCCMEQNVTSACMEACNFYLDIDSVIEKPECVADFDKLMKCAADGSDHRSCCAAWGVPRRCLDWCRGEPLLSAKLCVLSHTKQIAGCFHEGRDKLPGPPQNVRVVALDERSVRIKWDRPMKNPHTVEIYRVFWRPIGIRTPEKIDTKDTSLHITELKEGVTYECVIKAGNHFGTSALTEPIQFTVGGDKYVVAAASINNNLSHGGLLLAVVLICAVVTSLLVALVWLVRNRKIFGIKSLSGVAFENPSYLKEINTDIVVQNGIPQTATATGGGTAQIETSMANGAPAKNLPSVSGGTIPRQELLLQVQQHIPIQNQHQQQREVNPSLYEELKLGQEGAGFKRLKLSKKDEERPPRVQQQPERRLFEDVRRKDAY